MSFPFSNTVSSSLIAALFVLICLAGVAFPFGSAALAAGPEEAGAEQLSVADSARTTPVEVEVGVWLSGIYDIDFLDGSFTAEIYIWFISSDPDFQPFETLQVLNGRDWTQRAVFSQYLPDGRHYVAGFLNTTVTHDWDLLYYPFDRQTLDIVIETPLTSEQLRFIPQNERSMVGEFVEVEGFRIDHLIVAEQVASYASDFGLDSASASQYSRLVVEIFAERESGRIIIAMLVGFIVANIIALLTFAIDVSQISIRVSMVGSAIFAAIGNMYLLNSQMSPAVGSIIVDRFAVGTFSAILVALLCGILVNTLATRNRVDLALWINRGTFVVLLASAAAFYTATVLLAIESS